MTGKKSLHGSHDTVSGAYAAKRKSHVPEEVQETERLNYYSNKRPFEEDEEDAADEADGPAQLLLAREGEQLLCQRCRPVRRTAHVAQPAPLALDVDRRLAEAALEHVEIAGDDLQDVVEVVRDAARQLADRFRHHRQRHQRPRGQSGHNPRAPMCAPRETARALGQ